MSKRHYANWLSAYLQYSSASESPLKFHFWTAISTIAGALRRKVYVDQVIFQWIPNFYIIFVAEPGIVSKSTTADIGLNVLKEVPEIKMGPSRVTWEALIERLEQSRVVVERGDKIDYMCAVTIASSELGNLLNPKKNGEMIDCLVDLWDCKKGVSEKVTKTMGSNKIENPYINLIGCTTPGWIAGNFPEYMVDGGFTARCIFVYGDKKRHRSALPGNVMKKSGLSEMLPRLLEDLTSISLMEGEFHFTPEAEGWMDVWYNEHMDVLEKGGHTSITANYLARKQSHLVKLAMVLSAAKSGELVLSIDTLNEARQVLEGAEAEIPRVFSHIGLTPETRAIGVLIAFVQTRKAVSYAEAYRLFLRTLTGTRFDEVVRSAIRSGAVRSVTRNEITYLVATEVAP